MIDYRKLILPLVLLAVIASVSGYIWYLNTKLDKLEATNKEQLRVIETTKSTNELLTKTIDSYKVASENKSKDVLEVKASLNQALNKIKELENVDDEKSFYSTPTPPATRKLLESTDLH